MAAAVTERTRLILVCTPNNPTGPVVHAGRAGAFLDRVPRDVLVVIDEAYTEFVRDDQAPDALAVLPRAANVAVLRTFSKAYGLAGLRVGYAVAHPPVAQALRKTAVPFGVSTSPRTPPWRRSPPTRSCRRGSRRSSPSASASRRRCARRAGRCRAAGQLRLVPARRPDTPDFAAACDAPGVVVRPFAGEGVRVTIGEPEANDRLIEVAGAFRRTLPHEDR